MGSWVTYSPCGAGSVANGLAFDVSFFFFKAKIISLPVSAFLTHNIPTRLCSRSFIFIFFLMGRILGELIKASECELCLSILTRTLSLSKMSGSQKLH